MKPQSSKQRVAGGDFGVRSSYPTKPTSVSSAQTPPAIAENKPEPSVGELRIKKLKKRWKKFRLWALSVWQPFLLTVSVTLIVCTVLGFQIGSLTHGLSSAEQQYISSVDSGKEILHEPSFIVHKLPTYILFKLNIHRVAYYRLISAAYGAVAVLSGFYIIRRWYSTRVAILGSWLILTSAWFLHTARLATAEASFLLLMPLLWVAVWMYTTRRRHFALIALFAVSSVCFYIPGFLWLVIGAVIWQRKVIYSEIKHKKWWFVVLAFFSVVLALSPMVYAAIINPKELLLVAGLPDHLPTIKQATNNFIEIPIQLFLRGHLDPVKWLGRLPLLDIFGSITLLLGIYSLRHQVLLIRAQLIVFSSIILVLLLTLGGMVSIVALLPILYILIAGGIAFMLQQWFVVFPRNPIARGIATTLMTVLVLMVSYYNINHYFIAWPQTPATRQAFGFQISNSK